MSVRTCYICFRETTPRLNGDVDFGHKNIHAHPLCLVLRNITTLRTQNKTAIEVDVKPPKDATMKVRFPRCKSEDGFDYSDLYGLVAAEKCFYCQCCRISKKEYECIIADWSGSEALETDVAAVVTPSKNSNRLLEAHARKLDFMDCVRNCGPPEVVMAQYQTFAKSSAVRQSMTVVKYLAMVYDENVIEYLTSKTYNFGEMIQMGLTFEIAVSYPGNWSFLLHRVICPANQLACVEFGASFTKMLLAGMNLSDFVMVGYDLSELSLLKFNLPAFLACKGTLSMLLQLFKVTTKESLFELVRGSQLEDAFNKEIVQKMV